MTMCSSLKLLAALGKPIPFHAIKMKTDDMSKKLVVILAEGTSEQAALESILAKLVENHRLVVNVVSTDVTSKYSPSAIKAGVGEAIKAALQKDQCLQENVTYVLHIIDTDGTFVPSSAIVEDSSLSNSPVRGSTERKRWQYSTKAITVPNKAQCEKRNQNKARNMSILSGLKELVGINYAAFYMSRNLEHALHNISAQLSDKEKISLADEFNDKFIENLLGFKNYINSSDLVHFDNSSGDLRTRLKASWDYISTPNELYSLERASNLNLLVEFLESLASNPDAE